MEDTDLTQSRLFVSYIRRGASQATQEYDGVDTEIRVWGRDASMS